MNENAIVEELYETIDNHGVMETICAVFGKGAQIELGFTQKLCDTEIKDLDITVRAYNGLMRAGCKTIGQLIEKINEGSLLKVRQLGVKSVAELRAFIVECGYAQASERRKKEFLHRLVQLNSKK